MLVFVPECVPFFNLASFLARAIFDFYLRCCTLFLIFSSPSLLCSARSHTI